MKTETNVRPPRELLQVFLDNQELFSTTLYGWLNKLRNSGKITYQEKCFVLNKTMDENGKYHYSDILNIGSIQNRIDFLKEKLK